MNGLRKSELERRRELAPADDLHKRIDRLERAFSTELTGAVSLNIRGMTFAACSAIAIVLLAQFSSIWLDDGHWEFLPDVWDLVMQIVLVATAVAFAICVLMSVYAVWPRRSFAPQLGERVEKLNEGAEQEEAALLLRMLDTLRASNERKGRFMRLATLPFLVGVAGAVIQSLIFAFVAELVDPARSDRPGAVEIDDETGLPPPEERLVLALRHAPRVWLHSDERFGPLDPDDFIEGSELEWQRRRGEARVAGRGSVSAARLGRGCETAKGGCYVFEQVLARELTRPFSRSPDRPGGVMLRRGFALDLDNGLRRGQSRQHPSVPVFYDFRRTSHDELLITYWFSYGFSTPHVGGGGRADEILRDQLAHEGDWENVDVALTTDGSTPVALYLYGHGKPTRRTWSEVETLRGHPVIYSALDSHASYSASGTTRVCGDLGSANDIRDQGFRWDTWRGAEALRPVRAQPWFGYGGAWGAADPVEGRTGPLGPSRWKLPADPDPGDLGSSTCHQ